MRKPKLYFFIFSLLSSSYFNFKVNAAARATEAKVKKCLNDLILEEESSIKTLQNKLETILDDSNISTDEDKKDKEDGKVEVLRLILQHFVLNQQLENFKAIISPHILDNYRGFLRRALLKEPGDDQKSLLRDILSQREDKASRDYYAKLAAIIVSWEIDLDSENSYASLRIPLGKKCYSCTLRRRLKIAASRSNPDGSLTKAAGK